MSTYILANPPNVAAPRVPYWLALAHGGVGTEFAESPTIGFPYTIESVLIIFPIDATALLSFALIVAEAGLTDADPLNGRSILEVIGDSLVTSPKLAPVRRTRPLLLRPRACVPQSGTRLRFVVNTTSTGGYGARFDLSVLS